jgi:hypothetical protein
MEKSDRESQGLQELGGEETIDLALPPSTDATQLLRFMFHLEETCRSDHRSARIIRAGGSFNQDTFITISPGRRSLADIIGKISAIPEVEKVEEDPPASIAVSRFAKIFARLRSSRYGPSNRLRIILNGTSIDRQKLETV